MPAQKDYVAVRRMSLASTVIKLILTIIILLGAIGCILFAIILTGGTGDDMMAIVLYAIAAFWVLILLIFIVSTILGFVLLNRNKRYLEQWQQLQDQQDQTFYPYKYLRADAIVNLVISALGCCCITPFVFVTASNTFGLTILVPFIAILILSVISLIRMK